MIDYPLEPGQRMIVRPNAFGPYAEHGHRVVCLENVVSTQDGIIANCNYVDNGEVYEVTIPFFLLWRIADDEDLLELHEKYVHSRKIHQTQANEISPSIGGASVVKES